MEKYFRIPKENRFYEMYVEYKDMATRINDAMVKFFKKNEITTHEYYPFTECLHICPTEQDEEKFGKYFKKDTYGKFKKTSPLGKAWVQNCKELGLKYISRPSLAFEFGIYGRSRQRLCMIDDALYGSIETDYDFKSPEELQEIKASEFFKVIEDYEESLKAGEKK